MQIYAKYINNNAFADTNCTKIPKFAQINLQNCHLEFFLINGSAKNH